eukprot:TRINITY_DN8401_c0_g1_i1.p2 TRINITY_DN8401_c0_g1~~TRINITY_DN8401_c0_g1_i1.p2  ORF type:complete len:399 (+),score=76.13 TRINITY_DN8401_c0_g1_i1:66-1262(+)
MPVCKYFQQGHCRFGATCKNTHPGAGRSQGGGYGALSGMNSMDFDGGRGGRGRGASFLPRGGFQQQYQPTPPQYGQFGRGRGGFQQPFTQQGYQQAPMRQQPAYHQQHQQQQQEYQPYGRGRGGSGRGRGRGRGSGMSHAEQQTRIKTIQDDIRDWEKTKLWPFSSYSWKPGEASELPDEYSFDEVRYTAYAGGDVFRAVQAERQQVYKVAEDRNQLLSNPDYFMTEMAADATPSMTGASAAAGMDSGMMLGPSIGSLSSLLTAAPTGGAGLLGGPMLTAPPPLQQSVMGTTNISGLIQAPLLGPTGPAAPTLGATAQGLLPVQYISAQAVAAPLPTAVTAVPSVTPPATSAAIAEPSAQASGQAPYLMTQNDIIKAFTDPQFTKGRIPEVAPSPSYA